LIGLSRGKGKNNFVDLSGGETFVQVNVSVELFTQRRPIHGPPSPREYTEPQAVSLNRFREQNFYHFLCMPGKSKKRRPLTNPLG
jgi:hypothetical protein